MLLLAIETRVARSLPGTEGHRDFTVPSRLPSLELPSTSLAPSSSRSRSKDAGEVEENAQRDRALEEALRRVMYKLDNVSARAESQERNDNDEDMDVDAATGGSVNDGNDGSYGDDGGRDQGNDDKFTDAPEVSEEEISQNEALDLLIEAEELPEWLGKAVDYLRRFDGHRRWIDMIAVFLEFERHVASNPGKVSGVLAVHVKILTLV